MKEATKLCAARFVYDCNICHFFAKTKLKTLIHEKKNKILYFTINIAFNFLLFCLLLHAPAQAQEDTLSCNGELIFTLYAEGDYTYLKPDFQNGVYERAPISGIQGIFRGLDLFAYRKTDNCIYALSQRPNDSHSHLYKMTASGQITPLIDTVLIYTAFFQHSVGMAITQDQRYLVMVRNFFDDEHRYNFAGIDWNRPNSIYLVDLDSPTFKVDTLTAETTGDAARVILGDLAADPMSHLLYGFDRATGRLATLDPFTGFIDNTSRAESAYPTSVPPVAVMFTPFGELVAVNYGSWAGAENSYMLYIDKETGRIDRQLFAEVTVPSNPGEQGCSCPYVVGLEQRASPAEAVPCQELTVSIRMAYLLNEVQSGLRLTDSFPPHFSVQEVLYNPYGGTVSGLGTSLLQIDGLTPIRGVDSILLRVAVEEQAEPGLHYCQAVLSGLNLSELGDERASVRSDYPYTPEKPDPTPITVLAIDSTVWDLSYGMCPGEEVRLAPAARSPALADAFSFQWADGYAGAEPTVSEPGQYTLTVTNACGDFPLEVTVVDASIEVALEQNRPLLHDDSLLLEPIIASNSPIQLYAWHTADSSLLDCLDCPAALLRPLQDETLVELTVTNESGCTATARLLVEVSRPVFAPTAFSPNADGRNDRFFLQTASPVAVAYLRVFDRWGGLVFEQQGGRTNDAALGWNGQAQGKSAPTGIYTWAAKLQYENGPAQVMGGELMLVR